MDKKLLWKQTVIAYESDLEKLGDQKFGKDHPNWSGF